MPDSELNRKLKILIITNLYPPKVLGGYERSIADFARILNHRGHQVLVLTTGDDQEFSANHTSQNYADPVIEPCLSLLGQWNGERTVDFFPFEKASIIHQQNLQTLAQRIQTFQPDVCLSGNIDLLGNFELLNVELLEQILLANVPVAHYVMNFNPGYPPEATPLSPLHRFITCSDWVIESLRQKGYPVETAQTVYPGAAIDEFYQPELPTQGSLRIAYASLLMYYKGTDVLVEALCLLNALGIEFTATIAGGTFAPQYVEILKDLVVSEGLEDRITFPGVLSRQELIQLYKTHNVLAFPSRFQEPFGISQIEAMAAGLTLVTSGTGGAREIVEHGQDGLLFESENPIELADALTSLLTNPTEWEAMTRRGQQKAITQFSQAKAAEALEAILLDLAAQAASLR